MKILLLTAGISFLVIAGCALLINFSKRRQQKSPHGLTGMCHRTGGVVCSSCNKNKSNKRPRPKGRGIKPKLRNNSSLSDLDSSDKE